MKTTILAKWRLAAQVLLYTGFTVGVVLLMLWLAGKFTRKVPGEVAPQTATGQVSAAQTAPVRVLTIPRTESAVGQVRAVLETSIGSKLLARVLEVRASAGQVVKAGEVLVRLDDTDLRAKLRQVEAAQKAAEAVRNQALADEQRYAELLRRKAVSTQQYEQAQTALRSAEAELRRAEEAANEVRAMLDWATVTAPFDGIVIDKHVDAGQMVIPGQKLVTIYDPKQMELVAAVRESLAHRLQVGQNIEVVIEGLQKQCVGNIREIIPQAQAATRTFQVKVTGPCPPGIYSGMFGRMLIPLDEEQVLVIPRGAVRQVGQVELVDVVLDGQVVRRAVRTGRLFGGDVEVLSGLQVGEVVVVHRQASSGG